MSKYKIALMPGDGVGVDVMEAAQLVLDKLALDADYISADIGWKFWCEEGNPLPQRTIDILNRSTCALFGAVTSRNPLMQRQESSPRNYRTRDSPTAVLLSIYGNAMTSTRTYDPASPIPAILSNYRDDIDLVVFRENTEGLYSGVSSIPFQINCEAPLPSTTLPWSVSRQYLPMRLP